MLLQLWMDKSYSSETWSVRQKLHKIESRYMNLSPPACISRLPRNLIENFGHLEASELRTFLLFYSVPCLYGILPDLYFQHFILLVEAIYLSLQDSVSVSTSVKLLPFSSTCVSKSKVYMILDMRHTMCTAYLILLTEYLIWDHCGPMRAFVTRTSMENYAHAFMEHKGLNIKLPQQFVFK